MNELIEKLLTSIKNEIEENNKAIIAEDNARTREIILALNDALSKSYEGFKRFLAMYTLGHLILDADKEAKKD